MLSDNITGGLECAPLSRITFKAVEHANNSKLIDHRQNQATYLPKAPNLYDLLPTVLWT